MTNDVSVVLVCPTGLAVPGRGANSSPHPDAPTTRIPIAATHRACRMMTCMQPMLLDKTVEVKAAVLKHKSRAITLSSCGIRRSGDRGEYDAAAAAAASNSGWNVL